MKAIIAITNKTGEIRSATDGLEGYEYILKFGDKSMPIAEIETAYYEMAVAAGIEMRRMSAIADRWHQPFLHQTFRQEE